VIPAAAALLVLAATGFPSCLPGHAPVSTPPAPKLHVPAAGAFAMPAVGNVLLPGPAVRFEALSLDTVTNRLFLAHSDANQVVAFDVHTNTVVGTVDNIQRVIGLFANPDLGRVYAGGTAHGEIVVFDAHSLTELARATGVAYPVAVAYAPNPRRLFIASGEGRNAFVLEILSNQVAAEIPLGASAAAAVYDPVSACVLLTVGDQLVVVDPETDSIDARIALPGVLGAHAIAIDAPRRVAFVSSQANATVAVVDLAAGRLTSTVTVGRAPDGLAFDPGWGRLYVGSETGTVSVFTELPGATVTLVHEGDVIIPHGHTLTVDPRTHLLYLPLEEVDGHPRLLITAPKPPG
jgi:DNA-binding beta-propeller fold protein YncE